ncbi:phosphoadenylyl-sulfate reductase [Coraliomargarita sp. SDUM461004]|uniref:Phosphoadenosine 5'-phosphosulfate reductase n=1 Tax=Thalassobacterium sedimentorum TaxID=3041258 RepID=A0ABU1AFK6_9BACT|nr:phosphoadenylyl-sulfate reductase [Coraliomargarita sp. SDUM461004]MDQ8193339.1 phosphoadenylyl-sulfate reductase [Coraliomargarita sp. SDUM461004]
MSDSHTAQTAQTEALDLEIASATERVRWAYQSYGDKLVLTTSFGVQSAVMLHLVTTQIPQIPVIFVDTGYLFPATYTFAAELTARLQLNLKTYIPLQTAAQQEALHGKLWEQGLEGLERYNHINKVEPMNRAVKELGATAWLSGLRRTQSSSRGERKVIEKQNKITKIYPIIDWNDRDVYTYLTENDLPYHPLWDQGYVSVGDWHSTKKLGEGMTEEETRFGGLKRECGLHEVTGGSDFQI